MKKSIEMMLFCLPADAAVHWLGDPTNTAIRQLLICRTLLHGYNKRKCSKQADQELCFPLHTITSINLLSLSYDEKGEPFK